MLFVALCEVMDHLWSGDVLTAEGDREVVVRESREYYTSLSVFVSASLEAKLIFRMNPHAPLLVIELHRSRVHGGRNLAITRSEQTGQKTMTWNRP